MTKWLNGEIINRFYTSMGYLKYLFAKELVLTEFSIDIAVLFVS